MKEGDPTDRLAVDDAGARAQLCERVDNERKRYVSARSQSEYEASQAELRSAQEELQRVRSELKQATDQFRNEEAARMALETSNVELRYERERLNGIVTTQQNDLKKLTGTNNLNKRRIRHAAIAASVMLVVGLTTWLSGAHAAIRAGKSDYGHSARPGIVRQDDDSVIWRGGCDPFSNEITVKR